MDIVFSSTIQLAEAIRTKQVSACEVLEAHLAQIAKHNPSLNAIITLDIEGARERARAADEALARGEVWGPLHGVPFTLKDAHSTAGMLTTVGFPPFADYIPQEDGTVAARLKRAGGILVGKTNLPPMQSDYQSDNPLFGRTNNPYDVAYTPGGSSGGSAAAVAAGLTPFDIGTDLSGSIRIPAHFCGVFGLKPTEKRVSVIGMMPTPQNLLRRLRLMSSIGPLARTVEDLALLFSIIAGPDGLDTEIAPVPIEDVPTLALKDLRIAVAPTFPAIPVATEIRHAVEELAQQLESEGATVEEATLPALDYRQALFDTGGLIGMALGAFEESEQDPPTTLIQYFAGLHKRDQTIVAWERFFDDWDVLLCPPAFTAAFPHCETGTPLQVDGQLEEYWGVASHSALFSYTGHPAIVLPYQLNQDGLPIGVQLVGKRWEEGRLLGIAQSISQVTGEFRRPAGY